MSSVQDNTVLIVGANMVGAAQALSLAREGFAVTLVEPRLPPAFDPDVPPDIRVSAINLASEGLLRQFGAWEKVLGQRCHPYTRLAVWENNAQALPFLGQGRTDFLAREIDTPHLGHMIENVVIQRALLGVIAEHERITLLGGCGLADIHSRDSQGVTVSLTDGSEHRAALLIGADGGQSQVRKLAGLGVREDRYQQEAMVIGIAHRGPALDITWQAFRPEGPLAYLPLASVAGQAFGSLVWYEHGDGLKVLDDLDDPALIQRIKQVFPAELPDPQSVTGRARFPLIKRHARHYGSPGVLLVGDAAHTINPLAGQGVNLGFRDVAGLTRAVLEGCNKGFSPGHPWIAQRYEHYRRRDNLMMMSLMDGFYYLFSNDLKPIRTLRRLGLGLAAKMPMARKQVLGYATGRF